MNAPRPTEDYTLVTAKPDAFRTETYRGDDAMRLVIIPIIQNLLGGVAVCGSLCVPLFIIWYLTDWSDPIMLYGAVAVGAMVTFMATFIRFFADDFGLLMAAYYRGRKDALPPLREAQRQIINLEGRLRDAQHVVHASTVKTFVEPEARDPAWEDAHLLLRLVRGSRLPGRNTSGLSQRAQDAAIDALIRAKTLRRNGNHYDLVTTVDEAVRALDALASSNQVRR